VAAQLADGWDYIWIHLCHDSRLGTVSVASWEVEGSVCLLNDKNLPVTTITNQFCCYMFDRSEQNVVLLQ